MIAAGPAEMSEVFEHVYVDPPIDLVRQWVETGTENYPEVAQLPPYHGLVLISGSNDLLLERLISTFNLKHQEHMAMFGLTGSMGGLKALRMNLCHIAASHLVADNEEYNFPFIKDEMIQAPAVVNLCLREQGLMVEKGNPQKIASVAPTAYYWHITDKAAAQIFRHPWGWSYR